MSNKQRVLPHSFKERIITFLKFAYKSFNTAISVELKNLVQNISYEKPLENMGTQM